jgi:hypothetical protein
MARKADNGAVPTSRRKPVSRRLTFSFLAAISAIGGLFSPAGAFARAYSGADRDVPLARFEDAVCPGILGIEQVTAEGIVGLIRQNAAELGLRLGDPATCEPNMLVMVIDDPHGYLEGLRQTKPYLFRSLDNNERRHLFDEAGAVHLWQQVLVRSREGISVYPSLSLSEPPWTTMHAAHSLIYVPTRRDIIYSMVLIEKNAVQGLNGAQLADYVTMRGLAGDQAKRLEKPGNTILTLFDAGAAKPSGLTASDRIFLKTLYSTMPNVPAAITLSLADERIADGKIAE